MLKRILFTVLIIIVLILAFGVKTYYDAGEFKTLTEHFDGECEIVGGVSSSEDITIDAASGRAFISSTDRRAFLAGRPMLRGDVFVYELDGESSKPAPLNLQPPHDFNPHGIDVFRNNDSTLTLLVVNHNAQGHFIEVFRERDSMFVHEKSLQSPLMHSPNDVVAVDENRFYVTNDHGNTSAFGKTLEDYLQLNRSFVIYYDGESFRKAAEGFAYANGVNISRDGKSVYVAATSDAEISVFDRDISTGDLTLREKIDLDTGVDNIEIDEAGNLWVGAHPKLLTFVGHAQDAATFSPSQVLKLTPDQNGGFKSEEIYLEKGERLSASSVAAVYGKTLLIGAVFDAKFLVCKTR